MTNKNNYVAPKSTITQKVARTVKTSGLLAGERESAPRASFFGRIEGKEVTADGKYEDKWLNSFEFNHWIKQKEYKKALKAGLVDETDEDGLDPVNSITKIDKW